MRENDSRQSNFRQGNPRQQQKTEERDSSLHPTQHSYTAHLVKRKGEDKPVEVCYWCGRPLSEHINKVVIEDGERKVVSIR